MRTERGFDRIVNFSDATVAIAMTLLVLPLVDLGGDTEPRDTLWDLLSENSNAIFGFLLGFLVIWSMWVNHHRVMEYFADYDSTVLALHLLWLLTMVTIPFTTQLITNNYLYQHGATALYVAVLLVSSISLHLLGLRGRQHPGCCTTGRGQGVARRALPLDDGRRAGADPRHRADLPERRRVADAAALRRRVRREPLRPAPEVAKR